MGRKFAKGDSHRYDLGASGPRLPSVLRRGVEIMDERSAQIFEKLKGGKIAGKDNRQSGIDNGGLKKGSLIIYSDPDLERAGNGFFKIHVRLVV